MCKQKQLKCKTVSLKVKIFTNNFIPFLHIFSVCLFSLREMFQKFFNKCFSSLSEKRKYGKKANHIQN